MTKQIEKVKELLDELLIGSSGISKITYEKTMRGDEYTVKFEKAIVDVSFSTRKIKTMTDLSWLHVFMKSQKILIETHLGSIWLDMKQCPMCGRKPEENG